AADDPIEQVDVAAIEQGFEPIQLIVVKLMKGTIGERADNEVDLLGAAVPRAEQEPPAAYRPLIDSGGVASAARMGHDSFPRLMPGHRHHRTRHWHHVF